MFFPHSDGIDRNAMLTTDHGTLRMVLITVMVKIFLATLVALTAEIRPYENPRALQGRTVFNRYLGNG